MRAIHLIAVVLLALISNAVLAHETSMAEMEVRETAPGEFLWQWTASGSKPASSELTPVWPSVCRSEPNAVRCGEEGLKGTLRIDGVHAARRDSTRRSA